MTIYHKINFFMLLALFLSSNIFASSVGNDGKQESLQERLYVSMSFSQPLTREEDPDGNVKYSYTVSTDPKTGYERPTRLAVERQLEEVLPEKQSDVKTNAWTVGELIFHHCASLALKCPQLHPTREYACEYGAFMLMGNFDTSRPNIAIRPYYKDMFDEHQGKSSPEDVFFLKEQRFRDFPFHIFWASNQEGGKQEDCRPWQLIISGTDGLRWSELDIAKKVNEAGFNAVILDYAHYVHRGVKNSEVRHASLNDQLTNQSFLTNALVLHTIINYIFQLPGFAPDFNIISNSLGSSILLLAYDPLILSRVSTFKLPRKIDIIDPMPLISSPKTDPRFAACDATVYFAKQDQMFGDQTRIIQSLLPIKHNWTLKKSSHKYHDGLGSSTDYGRFPTRNPDAVNYQTLCHAHLLSTFFHVNEVNNMLYITDQSERNERLMNYVFDIKVQRFTDEKMIPMSELCKTLENMPKPMSVVVGLDQGSFAARDQLIEKILHQLKNPIKEEKDEVDKKDGIEEKKASDRNLPKNIYFFDIKEEFPQK